MFAFDSLSYIFLFLILLGVVPNLFYTFGYLPHIKRKAYFLVNYFGFIISMIGVVLSSSVLVFLFFWEVMSLTSWQLILTENTKESISAGRFYFFMTHFGFIFILLFFLILSPDNLMSDFNSLKIYASNFKYPTFLFFLITQYDLSFPLRILPSFSLWAHQPNPFGDGSVPLYDLVLSFLHFGIVYL